jgi:mono/diheme cytochrome c family protein
VRRPVVYAAAALVAAALSLATAAARPDSSGSPPLDGAELFRIKGCATCHQSPGIDATIGVGPSLAHAPSWASTRVEGMTAEAYLRQSMAEPSAFISPAYTGASGPSAGMPLLQLSSDEIDALVTYLLDSGTRSE